MIDPRFVDALETAADLRSYDRIDGPTRRQQFAAVLANFAECMRIPGRYNGRPGRNVDVFSGQCECGRKWMQAAERGTCACGRGIEVDWR